MGAFNYSKPTVASLDAKKNTKPLCRKKYCKKNYKTKNGTACGSYCSGEYCKGYSKGV